ncbi:hypothetical protein PPL_10696 [Heterostelium album PN500]|uniref:Uncharacterized protein n=1 Tax=Heterostelium pallidum (strain ATCC 26659 / Pp 5 / PN500) TaxID=670386 RepID=D3BRT5_HETP5|nr:hypothetical protein PPL_10696 [Heterostelium album PN500]EFA76117.1 hypothetical protein PPL_10696 [Heterostelium album PN500]|eukprot:XP_020428251.1 hypothetical protein PPL_10696 [Heterostelium album PN500]
MRFKVTWKENKLVIPAGNINDKVSRLFKDIGDRFTPYNPSDDDLIISELRTADGFFVSPHLTISDALVDGDYLTAVDFDTWKNEQYKLCKTIFETIRVKDHDKDTTLNTSIGINTKNNLFISVSVGTTLMRLDLFDSSDLKLYAKDGKHLVTLYDNEETKASSKAFFVVENGSVVAVEVQSKTLTSPSEEIRVVKIQRVGKKISKLDVVNVQSAYKFTTLPNVTFPEPTKTGFEFPDTTLDCYTDGVGGNGTKPEDYFKVTSTSNIRFEQIDRTFVEHGWFQSDKGITNSFYYTDIQVVNNSSDKISLTKVSAEYQDLEGNWVAADGCFFGFKKGIYNYAWHYDATVVPITPKEVFHVALNVRIPIKKNLADKQRRSALCMADPLNIRITLIDSTQVSTVLPIKYVNKTKYPVVVTQASRQKYIGESTKIVHFQYIDSLEREDRTYVQIGKVVEQGSENLVFSTSLNSTTYYINNDTLAKFSWEAKKTKQSKLETKFGEKKEGHELKVHAIVDLESGVTTGLQIELSSKDASSTQYFVIPPLV